MLKSVRSLVVLALFALVPVAASGQDAVTWETLAQVKLSKQGATFVPAFEAPVQALAGKTITLSGFMLPLDQASEQSNFILSANPVANCFFCMPGGPETLVEVRASSGLAFSYDPIEITGRLELLDDDPMGMYYRLVDARVGG